MCVELFYSFETLTLTSNFQNSIQFEVNNSSHTYNDRKTTKRRIAFPVLRLIIGKAMSNTPKDSQTLQDRTGIASGTRSELVEEESSSCELNQ
jgi:hypothetical protein